jgi:hypothetical protein
MAGSSYANAASLNDAKELQKMFKGQSSASSGGKSRGKNKGGNQQGEISLGVAGRYACRLTHRQNPFRTRIVHHYLPLPRSMYPLPVSATIRPLFCLTL